MQWFTILAIIILLQWLIILNVDARVEDSYHKKGLSCN